MRISPDDRHVDAGDLLAKGLSDSATCRFNHTGSSPAVLAAGPKAAVMKISGDLVRLDPVGREDGTQFTDGLSSAELRDADDLTDMIVTAKQGYSAGFRGQYNCEGDA